MVLLAILDGLGLRSDSKDNAVCLAKTPTLERLVKECPNIPIDGSGPAVGLPAGQMGNSEVGHLNIGAGRVVYQDITLIDEFIRDGNFFSNSLLATGMKGLKMRGGALHLLGLVSDGRVHSSLYHLSALVRMAAMFKLPQVYLHAFTDGRDTSPTAGAGYIEQALGYFSEFGIGKLATVIGRYWAMDRDRRWERTQLAYDAMIKREGAVVADPVAALKEQYQAGETDEFVKPLIVEQEPDANTAIKNGDLVICFNFRADRLRQICYFLTGSALKGAPAPGALGVDLITMTKYDGELEAKIAFAPRHMNSILGEVVSNHSLKQLRISETEKYPHVTFFFNGGREEPFPGEEHKLIA
ncbi:MAG: 2,3-bisphosphoglycerate-independent phosphoglycerate mutase, partial [candidate division Zixibacteria bacterium]|nr:2,3-bisphosphoglycerate-independent phosphoglycerate mutase [candidate division Zixibacteria bacterium]